jgi:hypothetical protein
LYHFLKRYSFTEACICQDRSLQDVNCTQDKDKGHAASVRTGHCVTAAARKIRIKDMLSCIKLRLSLLPAEEEGFLFEDRR